MFTPTVEQATKHQLEQKMNEQKMNVSVVTPSQAVGGRRGKEKETEHFNGGEEA